MKKFAFLFVAVSAISFASCGNKAAEATEACDSTCCDTVAVDTVDTVAADTVVAE